MDPILILIALSFAGATTLSVLYTHQWLGAPDRVARRRIAPSRTGDLGIRGPVFSVRRSRIPFVELLPLSAEARTRMETELERAGVPLRVAEFLAIRVVLAVVGGLGGATVISNLGAPTWGILVGGSALLGLLWQLPQIWLAQKRNGRLDAVERQLPSALTAIAKSLRAGTGLLQAIDFATTQVGDPLGPELATTLRQIRLGANPEDAFAALSQRIGSPDLDIAVTAILIQRSVGGNLSEILTNVSETIIQRERLHREIKVLTSRQKLTGNFVAAIPILVAGAFIGLNRELGELLLGTTPGRIALAIGIAFEVAGIYLIRRLAKIEV